MADARRQTPPAAPGRRPRGDILAGIYDHHAGGLALTLEAVGPVTAVSGIRHHNGRDWITLTLHDGSTHELATGRWVAVHCPHQP